MKQNKYKNIKSFGYSSKKEHKKALELKLLLRAGEIRDLQEQVTFELQPSFKDNQGKTIRAINYIADFFYYDNIKKAWVVNDSKGFKTKDYLIKAKMFKFKYPQYIFIES